MDKSKRSQSHKWGSRVYVKADPKRMRKLYLSVHKVRVICGSVGHTKNGRSDKRQKSVSLISGKAYIYVQGQDDQPCAGLGLFNWDQFGSLGARSRSFSSLLESA